MIVFLVVVGLLLMSIGAYGVFNVNDLEAVMYCFAVGLSGLVPLSGAWYMFRNPPKS